MMPYVGLLLFWLFKLTAEKTATANGGRTSKRTCNRVLTSGKTEGSRVIAE